MRSNEPARRSIGAWRRRSTLAALSAVLVMVTATGASAAGPTATGRSKNGVSDAPAVTAALALTPRRVAVGHVVVASVAGSRAPRGRRVTVVLRWGDGSNPITRHSLKARMRHRYHRAGRFHVRLTVRVGAATSRAAAVETVVGATVRAVPGHYTAGNGQGSLALSFYISADGATIQDMSDGTAVVSCVGGGALGLPMNVVEIPIGAGGAFSSTTTEKAIVSGSAATITRTFSGHLTGPNAAGVPQASGSWREDLALETGASCTSNTLSWSGSRDSQPAQTSGPPVDGSYQGTDGQGNIAVKFHVAAGGTVVQGISDPAVAVGCMGGGALGAPLTMADTPIAANGSFAVTATEQGVVAGQAATITSSFRGNFHSVDSAGIPRAAGTWRQDVVLTATGQACSSNVLAWSVTRVGP
jgi:hypothetical protein